MYKSVTILFQTMAYLGIIINKNNPYINISQYAQNEYLECCLNFKYIFLNVLKSYKQNNPFNPFTYCDIFT